MSNSNEAPFQINLKTPGGIGNIVALEQTVTALGALSNAGLNPQPVAQQQHYATQTAAPAASAPVPVGMGGTPNCDHGLAMRLVPAGISKAGKPYKSFYACAQPRESACSAKG